MNVLSAVISDLDGTLLNKSHALSEKTIEVIKNIEAKGILFIIATGRHFKDVLMLKDKIGANPYIITANGALVCNPKGEIIYQSIIPKNVVKDILALSVPEVVYKNIYQDDLWLMERVSTIFDEYYDEGGFKYTICNFEDRLNNDTNKVFFTSHVPEALLPIHDEIKRRFGDAVDTTFSLPQVLEVMAKGTNKGTSLERLLGQLDIKPENCVAFGDGLNDVEMLDFVGNGFIMGNGDQKLKEKLPHIKIIGTNHEDAVATSVEAILEGASIS